MNVPKMLEWSLGASKKVAEYLATEGLIKDVHIVYTFFLLKFTHASWSSSWCLEFVTVDPMLRNGTERQFFFFERERERERARYDEEMCYPTQTKRELEKWENERIIKNKRERTIKCDGI